MRNTARTRFTVPLLATIAAAVIFHACQDGAGPGKTSPQSNTTVNTTGSANSSVNFIAASNAVTPAVVHIKTKYNNPSTAADPIERIFGGGGSVPIAGSGSGVTISADGFIATNNHVVENASGIEVIFPDRRSFTAELVGRDPNTDLALLKVKASGLPVVKMGNSDQVQVGEWVLAVGYPYSLNTTVTAGIVSAKGRSIGLINQTSTEGYAQGESPQANTAIESFIQTDAAINPGNSGGALVNTNGELIGINTAIASLTGSYAGYAFAIPVNLVRKILDDLKQFGTVKRGILGVAFPAPSVEDQYLKQKGINPATVKGVLITDIQTGSAAAEGGLKEGDIIQSIDSIQLNSSAEFSERIARHRPGDKISLTYLRDGKVATTSVTLKEGQPGPADGNPQSLQDIYDKLGATFAPLTPALKQRYDLNAGVVVTEVLSGGFFSTLGIPPGTIIAYVNGRAVNSPKDIETALMEARNTRVQILGVAPDGSRVAFNFSLGA